MSYYRQIDGIRYDRALIEAAEEAISGRGDGRISLADAERLLPLVTDGGTFTAAEQLTVAYLQEHFTWTDKADQWFRAALKDWGSGSQQPRAVRSASASRKEGVIILRVGVSKHLDIPQADQAAGCAVLLANTSRIDFSKLWALTRPHKEDDLPKDDERALCNAALDFMRANVDAVIAGLGPARRVATITAGFDNVPAAALTSALETLGFRVVEESDLG